jgi:hypothetical protein
VGVGGKAKKVKAGWIGIGGKARLFYSAISNIVNQLTNMWTGYYYDYYSSSGKNHFGARCNNGSSYTYGGTTWSTISGNTLTVYCRWDADGGPGFSGRAVKISSQKLAINNGQKVKVKLTVNNAGTSYSHSNLCVHAYTAFPTGGNNSVFQNSSALGNDQKVKSSQTEYTFTFSGTSGSYYIGVGLIGWATHNEDTLYTGGQVTIQSVEIIS